MVTVTRLQQDFAARSFSLSQTASPRFCNPTYHRQTPAHTLLCLTTTRTANSSAPPECKQRHQQHRGSRPTNVLGLLMQTTRSNLARSKTSPADPVLTRTKTTSSQHASHSTNVPLSERDSIFATSYQGDTPVTSPHHPRKLSHHQRDGLISQALQRHQLRQDPLPHHQQHLSDQPGQHPHDSATQTHHPEQSPSHHQPSLDHDAAMSMSASSLSTVHTTMTDLSMFFHTLPHTDLTRLPYPLTSKPNRHSLYDPQLLPALERPTTPDPSHKPHSPKGTTTEDLQSSAHRESYRAWRQGQGRMAGKSIAESQGRNLNPEDNDVDRKIDAKMPKIDQGLNVRSRKTSHYLGLFKDHDSEHEKRREKRDRAKHTEEPQDKGQVALSAINEHHELDEQATNSTLISPSILASHATNLVSGTPPSIVVDDSLSEEPSTSTDVASIPTPAPSTSFEAEAEQEPSTTDNAEGRVAHQVPPSLLEEIRNHHIILDPANNKPPSDCDPSSGSFEKVSQQFSSTFLATLMLQTTKQTLQDCDSMLIRAGVASRNTSYIAIDESGTTASTRSSKGGRG
jgi:inositol-hexakisphosphate kinase